MPHFILERAVDPDRFLKELPDETLRWGQAILKVERVWRAVDRPELLVQGVVVEFSRPLHPVALLSWSDGKTHIHLWHLIPVVKTDAVKRWLAVVASAASRAGAGRPTTTNLGTELWGDLGLGEEGTPATSP